MKIHTVTGGDRDYLELVPEVISEAASLVFLDRSVFIVKEEAKILLVVTPESSPFLALRIFLSPPRGTQLDLRPPTTRIEAP